jgi:hypothetical protein
LRDTLLAFTPAIAGFRVDHKVAKVAFMVTKTMDNKDKSSAGLSAREHHQLMMVHTLALGTFKCHDLFVTCFDVLTVLVIVLTYS